MKHPADDQTQELPGMPQPQKKRGRPATGKAKSAAERMAEYRARKQQTEPDKGIAMNGLERELKAFTEKPDKYQYHETKGWIWALNYANIISDEQRNLALEWIFCVWRQNYFA